MWPVLVQSLILQIAQNWLEQEKTETEKAKATYMSEHCPSPDLSGDQAALMVSPAVRRHDPQNLQRTLPSPLTL